MKNEEKIIELLTELAHKSDQNDKIRRRMDERIRQNEERLNNLDDISAGVLTLLRDLAKRSGETEELRDRIERLEKHTGLQ